MMVFHLIMSLLSVSAYAGWGGLSGDTQIVQSYACVSLDGLPIPAGTDQAKACCTSEGQLIDNPPKSCRVFTSIADDAADDVTGSLQVAANALNTARNLDGVSSDFSASDDSSSTTGGSSSTSPETSAIQSGTGGLDATTGSGSDLGALDFGNGSSDGSSGGASAGGAGSAGGGDGMSVGSLSDGGTDAALKNGASTSGAANANGDDSRLAYVGGGADGANGKSGFGFGKGANGSAGMDKSLKELDMGDQNGRDPNAMANADGEVQGTSEDPADYFSRIDRSANLFKIVSSRYLKKKSLFLIKQ